MTTHIALIILNIVMAIYGFFIIFMYLKSKIFHSYPYYFNIFYIVTILLNNLIRLIPKREEENEFEISIQCYIQGIFLAVLDKYMLCQITSYSLIYFLGSFYNQFFEKNNIVIIISLLEIGFICSLILATVFSIPGMSVGSQYCYVKTEDNTKFIVDTTFTSILFLISLYCTIRLIVNLIKLKKEKFANDIKEESVKSHTIRFSFNLVFNIVMYTYVILLILKKIKFQDDLLNFLKDMIYILLSYIGEIFFTVNTEVIKETKRIIRCQPRSITQSDLEKSLDVGSELSDQKKNPLN